MGPGNQRWGQFIFLILLISSFFYFILQADVEEDLEVDLQDKFQEKVYISDDFNKSINPISVEEQILRMKTNLKPIQKANLKPVQPQGLAPILNLM